MTGSMERPRQVDVWRTGGDKLVLEGRVRGEELASVASVLAIHPTRSKHKHDTDYLAYII